MFGRWLTLVPVRASRMRIASEQLGKCQARVDELKASLEKARAASQEWKAKAHDAEQRVAAATGEVAQQARQIERLQAQAARAAEQQARELAQLHARVGDLTEKRARDAADLRAHLATAERDLAMARDHLMTIDVKLDILEGAANVLDNRTRAILSARTAPDSEVTSQ
jgi:chromosome segregation ATPase